MNYGTLTFLGLILICNSLRAQGTVNFSTRTGGIGRTTANAPITDLAGTLLAGTNYWAQLYSGDGLSATEEDLVPAGVPVNFRTGPAAGYVQPPPVGVVVTQVPNGPASVQVRAWAGPFTSYEAAKSGGTQYGRSRILRIQTTGGGLFTDPNLVDADGSVNGFSLGGPPALSINDIVIAEGTNGTISASFVVTLSPASSQIVTVAYTTADGTALAGEDYVATNGTLTFQAGETNQSVVVQLTPDAYPEPDESFLVTLSNPVNALISRGEGTCIITEVNVTGISVDTSVSFNTVLSHIYLVERTDDPTMTSWTPVAGATDVVGTGGVVTIVDKGAGCATSRFYRARLIQ
jgi:hypothetical protein